MLIWTTFCLPFSLFFSTNAGFFFVRKKERGEQEEREEREEEEHDIDTAAASNSLLLLLLRLFLLLLCPHMHTSARGREFIHFPILSCKKINRSTFSGLFGLGGLPICTPGKRTFVECVSFLPRLSVSVCGFFLPSLSHQTWQLGREEEGAQ